MDEKEFLRILGENVRKLRKEKGLTIKQLAHQCDIEESNFIRLEKGRTNATSLTLLKVSRALNINLKDLLNFDTIEKVKNK